MPITLLKLTTCGVSFQNKKVTDLENLLKGDIFRQATGMIVIQRVKVTIFSSEYTFFYYVVFKNFI